MYFLKSFEVRPEQGLTGRWEQVVVLESHSVATILSCLEPHRITMGGGSEHYFQLIGARLKSVKLYITGHRKIEDLGWGYTYSLVCANDFGVIVHDSSGRQTLEVAKRVSNGKLLGTPRIRRPRFSRGAGGRGWTRLSDLAAILKLKAESLWAYYFHISLGDSETRPVALDSPYYETTDYDSEMNPQQLVSGDAKDPQRMWLPDNFVTDVCLMHHFGYRPNLSCKR